MIKNKEKLLGAGGWSPRSTEAACHFWINQKGASFAFWRFLAG
jgi:hypothetical protein